MAFSAFAISYPFSFSSPQVCSLCLGLEGPAPFPGRPLRALLRPGMQQPPMNLNTPFFSLVLMLLSSVGPLVDGVKAQVSPIRRHGQWDEADWD